MPSITRPLADAVGQRMCTVAVAGCVGSLQIQRLPLVIDDAKMPPVPSGQVTGLVVLLPPGLHQYETNDRNVVARADPVSGVMSMSISPVPLTPNL